MKDFFLDNQNTILKWMGIAALAWVLSRISKIFKGEDGKFQIKEFCQMSAFIIFTTLACYMIWMEANREHEWHLFDAVWIFIVFGSLLSVLHMDHVITNLTKIFELIVRLRAKSNIQKDEVE